MVHDWSFPEYPPEIFGKLPEGFVLEEQQIEMLCFWHRKALEAVDQLENPSDEELNARCGIKNRIFQAILSSRPS
ncbi:hypothetical protein CP49_01575 [Bradyrhizobium valentinum]|uniref:Uncharacterized protein n=1 Tax=Bradyrhizobium valentinum TaxID=1518501 RepID=A0A0R3LNW5_9BRAD|nr:hypothetical protein CP49_01575 [Bradyrhizobium valentinum]